MDVKLVAASNLLLCHRVSKATFKFLSIGHREAHFEGKLDQNKNVWELKQLMEKVVYGQGRYPAKTLVPLPTDTNPPSIWRLVWKPEILSTCFLISLGEGCKNIKESARPSPPPHPLWGKPSRVGRSICWGDFCTGCQSHFLWLELSQLNAMFPNVDWKIDDVYQSVGWKKKPGLRICVTILKTICLRYLHSVA